eukprot:TRINITY_DN1841_c0_g1_i1.p1 TRINITY_DN1841_c0_g1~~TRINITY_DN1841_c0_g1_i1.p1  ORF type:complete len:548 (-),score=105.99 TRINITY_DN1841_c0_g1_i1:46-1689(-)
MSGRWDGDDVSLVQSCHGAAGISRIAVERRRFRLVVTGRNDGSLSLLDLRDLSAEPLGEAARPTAEEDDEPVPAVKGYGRGPGTLHQGRKKGLNGVIGVQGLGSLPGTSGLLHAGEVVSSGSLGVGHADRVEALAWLPDDDRLFASGAADGFLKLWDAAETPGQQLTSVLSLDLHSPLRAAAFSPAQSSMPQVATALNDNTVRLVDLRSGRAVNTLQGHTRPPLCLTWGEPFASHLFSGGADGTIRAWDVRMGARSLFLFDPYAHEGERPLKRLDGEQQKSAAEERAFKNQDAQVQPYRFRSMKSFLGTDKKFLGGSRYNVQGGTVSSLAAGKQSRAAAEPEEERRKREQWNKEQEERSRHFFGPPRREYVHEASVAHRGAITSVFFCHQHGSGTFARLLSCGVDGKVRAWDPSTGMLLGDQKLEPRSMKRKMEGHIIPKKEENEEAMSGWKSTFDVESWTDERPLQLSALGHPEDICLVPEKEQVAVYCLRRGRLLCRLAAHTATVTCAEAIGPERREVLSAGEDGRLLCWRGSATTSSEVISLDD